MSSNKTEKNHWNSWLFLGLSLVFTLKYYMFFGEIGKLEEISNIDNPQKEKREQFNSSSVWYKLCRPNW